MPTTTRITLAAGLAAFMQDCRAANLSDGTLRFYSDKLPRFITWLQTEHLCTDVGALEPATLRAYFIALQENHSAGGVDAYWRAVSAFLSYLERDDFIAVSPLRKLRRPRVDTPLLPPIPLEDLRALVASCKGGAVIDRRDLAILVVLLDTGLRAGELLRLNIEDIDFDTGAVHVRKGKNRKARTVFLSSRTRRHLRTYLRGRAVGKGAPLFMAATGPPRRLTYEGLRAAIAQRAGKAQVAAPPLHAFRRTFAITSWRNGVDLVALVRLMGQGSLPVLMRYIAAETEELSTIHAQHAPVNNL